MCLFKMIFSFLIVSFIVTFSQAEEASQNYSGRQDNTWVDLQKELGELKVKLDAQQGIVSELLEGKKNVKGVIAQDQVEQLRQHDKKLQELTKEYTKKLNDYELKYPEKGQALGRQYSRKKNSKVSVNEKPTSFESRVQKINKKIKEQYRGSGDANTLDQIVRKIKAKKSNHIEAEKTKPIDVTDKMTVVK